VSSLARAAVGLLTALVLAAPAAPAKAALHLGRNARRHIAAEHFATGSRTRGKSLFNEGEDLDALVALAASAKPRREANGRDKRVVEVGRPIGTDGRSGKPVSTLVVIAEPDGEVVTAYPGR
jgi:hypothetical protein